MLLSAKGNQERAAALLQQVGVAAGHAEPDHAARARVLEAHDRAPLAGGEDRVQEPGRSIRGLGKGVRASGNAGRNSRTPGGTGGYNRVAVAGGDDRLCRDTGLESS